MTNVYLMERAMQTTETLSAATSFLFSQLVQKLLIPRFRDQHVHSGTVTVDGKEYTLYFKRIEATGLEIHFHRASKTIFLEYRKDLYEEFLRVKQQFPEPWGAGYSPAFDNPWLWLRLLTTYIETYPMEHVVLCEQQPSA